MKSNPSISLCRILRLLDLNFRHLVFDTEYYLQATLENKVIVDWLDFFMEGQKLTMPIFSSDVSQALPTENEKIDLLIEAMEEFDVQIIKTKEDKIDEDD